MELISAFAIDGIRLVRTVVHPIFEYDTDSSIVDPIQLASSPWKGSMHTSDLYYLFQGTK